MVWEIAPRAMKGGVKTEVWFTPLCAQFEGQKEGQELCPVGPMDEAWLYFSFAPLVGCFFLGDLHSLNLV